MRITDSNEYAAISRFYGDRTAKRSGVRLMNHIDEGLQVLDAISASDDAKLAFCLHPLFQADADLITAGRDYLRLNKNIDSVVLMLVMEYRHWANVWLSDKVRASRIMGVGEIDYPSAGPLEAVREMLIADKVQNYKDFQQHHKATHERSEELDFYFNIWLQELRVDNDLYRGLCMQIDA